jgi:glycosyltransferase involved in cell wall biosynthesis
VRVAGARLVRNDILGDRLWWWAERGFDRRVARSWAGRVPVLYGFELASSDTFTAHKRRGGRTILGQLIAHHRTVYSLLREELVHRPDAFSIYERRGLQTANRVNALKDRQYENSDLIIANSEFVRDSFLKAGFPVARIAVVSGAAPSVGALRPARDHIGPPIFLSAGTLSVRKGTHYLLDAWRRIHRDTDARLVLAGRNLLPEAVTANLPPSATIRGPLPPAELDRLYRSASALVLPSLCEGFALVILEAMARGLPIITTPNSGCGNFVVDGENGWIVPIRDSERLADRLLWAAHHPETLCVMGERSRARAATWTWDDYATAHTGVVRDFVEDRQ